MKSSTFSPFKGMVLSDYKPKNPCQEFVYKNVGVYLSNLDSAVGNGMGLTFIGPPGVGKTMLSCIVLEEAQRRGYSVKALEMSAWIDLYHRKFETSGKLLYDEVQKEWWSIYQSLEKYRKRTQFLLLDDIGNEYQSGSGWSNATFDFLIRYRHNRGLCTLLTTNLGLPLWTTKYSESLESFLHQSSAVITIEDDDYRKRSLNGEW